MATFTDGTYTYYIDYAGAGSTAVWVISPNFTNIEKAVIPSKVVSNGINYTVTGIGGGQPNSEYPDKPGFKNCNSLTSVTIPSTVTFIAVLQTSSGV